MPKTPHACRKLGINETALQKILAREEKPLSAYDLLPRLAKERKHDIAPVTVYRALNHLAQHGFVTRIESKNAYVLCRQPGKDHDCLFFICRNCGRATEAPVSSISKRLRQEAMSLGFSVNKQILEIDGFCKKCIKKIARSTPKKKS